MLKSSSRYEKRWIVDEPENGGLKNEGAEERYPEALYIINFMQVAIESHNTKPKQKDHLLPFAVSAGARVLPNWATVLPLNIDFACWPASCRSSKDESASMALYDLTPTRINLDGRITRAFMRHLATVSYMMQRYARRE